MEIGLVAAAVALFLWLFNKSSGSKAGGSADSWRNQWNIKVPDKVPTSVKRWRGIASQYAKKYGLPIDLVLAVIWQESTGYMSARGSAGEVGLMQIKNIAYEDVTKFGYEVPNNWRTDARANIAVGTAYLDLQRRRAGNIYEGLKTTKTTALESYNEGYEGSKTDIGLDEYAEEVKAKQKALKKYG